MKKLGGRRGNLGFRIFIAVFLISVTLVMAFPFWLVVVNSFASEASISKFGFQVSVSYTHLTLPTICSV